MGNRNSTSALGKLKDEYFQIENNDSLSTDQKVSRIINYTSAVCSAIAIQPIPFADIFVLTPIQAYMGTRLAAIYGIKIKEQKATEIVKQIVGAVGLGVLAQQLVIGAYKTFIPFLGAVTTIPLVYGMTFAIGKVMQSYFKARSEGRELTDTEIKNLWKESYSKGKEQGEANKNSIRNDAPKKTMSYTLTNMEINNQSEESILSTQSQSEHQSIKQDDRADYSFGTSITNPITVDGPIGESFYLHLLRTSKNQPMFFHRLGSIKSLDCKKNLDVFELVSVDSSEWHLLYFDMYHNEMSTRTPYGLKHYPLDKLDDKQNFCYRKFPWFGTTVFYLLDFPRDMLKVLDDFLSKSDLSPIADKVKEPIIERLHIQPEWRRPDSHLSKLDKVDLASQHTLLGGLNIFKI